MEPNAVHIFFCPWTIIVALMINSYISLFILYWALVQPISLKQAPFEPGVK